MLIFFSLLSGARKKLLKTFTFGNRVLSDHARRFSANLSLMMKSAKKIQNLNFFLSPTNN